MTLLKKILGKKGGGDTAGNAPCTGTDAFAQKHYQDINRARLDHLESLGLAIENLTVLDVGCGPGDLAEFFIKKGCRVVCVDGRPENIEVLHSRFPEVSAHVMDVETDPLRGLGVFDLVFCYGLLYHLGSPLNLLKNMAGVCKEMLLLETMICDSELPVVRIAEEPLAATQALDGLGCRPSPAYVKTVLNRVGFPYVYRPRHLPAHPQFQFKWKNNLDWARNGHPLRGIFVATKNKLDNKNLKEW